MTTTSPPSRRLSPLTGLSRSWGVAADSEGNVYVADSINDRVLKLPVQPSTRSSDRKQP
jgi:DNA-binding beta-propeller fold protein YncE